jgi:hypothetical protein
MKAMLFQLIEAIADRVRDQAAEYASAQARIGARTLARVAEPFDISPIVVELSPISASDAGADLQPPHPRSGRRAQSNSRLAAKRPQRQGRGLTSTFA